MVLSMVLPEKLTQTNGVEGEPETDSYRKTNFEKSRKIIHGQKNFNPVKGAGTTDICGQNQNKQKT